MSKEIEAMRQYGGSFAVNLANLWLFADKENRQKIEKTWPELFEKYKNMVEVTGK